jgi:hypothetical protein
MPHPERTYRMYFFVPYNLSPIQQGIQAGHASLEYAAKYANNQDFKDFVLWDKTWIILNGGTSNDGHFGNPKGSMEEIHEAIRDNGIPCAVFHEPDINSAMTAICFLADERVWDYENYPEFETQDSLAEGTEDYENLRKQWEESMGLKNLFLRNLIKNKKLA